MRTYKLQLQFCAEGFGMGSWALLLVLRGGRIRDWDPGPAGFAHYYYSRLTDKIDRRRINYLTIDSIGITISIVIFQKYHWRLCWLLLREDNNLIIETVKAIDCSHNKTTYSFTCSLN